MTSNIYLNIGSNNGDRDAFIALAVAALHSALPDAEITVSAPYESEPWGFESANRFINVGVRAAIERATDWTADELRALLRAVLAAQESVSRAPHRNTDGSYRDREVDIDIIAVDDIVYKDDFLELPHPRMHLRPFVLVPMAELAPEWTHPVTGMTCARMLQ